MFDLLKKTMLAGIGMTLMTKDKVEEVARDIASSANLSAEKGQQFVDEAVARAERGRADFEQEVRRITEDTLSKSGAATHEQVTALEARIAELERKLEERAA